MSLVDKSIEIGGLKLEGRILMPPIATYQCDENGMVTQNVCDYYAKRAKNSHVSLIITEHSFISQQGKAKEKQLSSAEDKCIDGLKNLVDTIHACGTKVFAQLNHAGSASMQKVCIITPIAPSSVILPVKPALGDGSLPREIAKTEIPGIVNDFVKAARRAKEAGYDGVEIHSAHGYLLNQFYSPLTNHRIDEYGGSLLNRLRIHREIIHAVRKEVGKEYPISVRFGGCDYMNGGSTIEDSVIAAKVLEQSGVDLLNISGGMCRYTRNGHTESGYFKDMSSAVKTAVNIPVAVAGGARSLSDAELLLQEQSADLVGIGRALLKDPRWEE